MGDEEETMREEALPEDEMLDSAPQFYCYEYQDDEEDGQDDQMGGMSLERMEQVEQSRTLTMLNQSEDRLFSHPQDVPSTLPLQAAPSKNRAFHYYSEGYEANHEPPDDQEVSNWQETFPFLRVVGGRGRENESSHVETKQLPETLVEMAVKQFASRGARARELEGGMDVHDGEEEEGVEEEIIAQHGSLTAGADGQALDANEMRLQQTIAILWPEVVENLRPLIQRVFAAGDAKGFPRDLAQLEAFVQQQSRPAYDHYADDDSWE